MSKRAQKLMTLFALTAVPLAAACAKDATDPFPGGTGPAEVAQLIVVPGHVMLYLGESVQLKAEMTGRDGTPLGGLYDPIQWTSSEPGVASISPSGVLLALAPGKARISAGCGDYYANASVTVLPPRNIDPPGDTAKAPGR